VLTLHFDYSRAFSRTDFKISVEIISHFGALKFSLCIWLSYYDFRSFEYLLSNHFSFNLYLIIIMITISSSYGGFLFPCYFYMITHWEKSFLQFLWQLAVGLKKRSLLDTEFLLFQNIFRKFNFCKIVWTARSNSIGAWVIKGMPKHKYWFNEKYPTILIKVI